MSDTKQPTLELVEHYYRQWGDRFDRTLKKRFKTGMVDTSIEERLGLYYAAKAVFVLAVCAALIQAGEDQDQQEIQNSIANDIEQAIHTWLRTMPEEFRTFLTEEEVAAAKRR